MTTTSRTTYNAGTPDRPTFAIPLSPLASDRATFIPAPTPLGPVAPTSPFQKLRNRWRAINSRVLATIQNNTGMLLIAASQAFFSLMNVGVKKLNSLDPPVPAFELIFVRMAITWICCVTYMFIMKVPDPFLGPKEVRLLLAFRGFVGFFGLFGVYYSLQYLSLSDATVLTFLAPMGTIVTGAIFLGEGFSWRQALAGFCSLIGVVLIARPEFIFGAASHEVDIPIIDGTGHIAEDANIAMEVTPAQRVTAVGVALIGVCGAIGAYTTIRAIGKRAHPLHNLVSFSSQCVIVSTIAILVMRVHVVIPTRLDWMAILLMIGIFGFIAQVLLTMGLQRETAGRGTMAVYVQIVFATTFERVFFHTTPPALSIVGTTIIMSSAIYVAVTKEDTGARKRAESLVNSAEDLSLEEGLLENQEEDPTKDSDPLDMAIKVQNGHADLDKLSS